MGAKAKEADRAAKAEGASYEGGAPYDCTNGRRGRRIEDEVNGALNGAVERKIHHGRDETRAAIRHHLHPVTLAAYVRNI